MSVDPNLDYGSHDPSDCAELSDDPRIRSGQEREARMRAALATKEDPLRDDETMHERFLRIDAAEAQRRSGASSDAQG